MHQRLHYCFLALFGVALVFATVTLAQSPGTTEIATAETRTLNPNDTWQGAQVIGSSKGRAFSKLFVVTLDRPDSRHPCRIQSFTMDKLVCSRVLGGPRTYLPHQVLALIVPGDAGTKFWPVLGLNGAMGTAIWGTVVFVATCPACAVGTGIAAFICFVIAGGILAADDQPDRLLYVAPGQKLSRKLGYVQY